MPSSASDRAASGSRESITLLAELGPELHILREVEPAQIECRGGESLVAEGVRRMRAGLVRIDPGYDGEYGNVQLLG